MYKLSLKTFGDSLFHDFVWIMLPTSLEFMVFWSENHDKLTLCLIGNRLTTSLLDTIPEFPVDLDALESISIIRTFGAGGNFSVRDGEFGT